MQQWSKTFIVQPTKFSLAALALLSFNLFSAPLIIENGGVLSSEDAEVRSIFKNERDYIVLTGKGPKKVKSHDVSKSLKRLSDKQLTDFLNNGYGLIKADRFTNGDFKLDMHVRGNGGGAIGATVGVIGGKAVVYGVSYGMIHLVSLCTGPFYIVTQAALTGVLAAPIEAASIYGAAVGGMTLAVATGPV